MATWQVQEAKSRFSELIEDAASKGPQTITRHGKKRAVVLSIEEYESLRKSKSEDFVAFLLNGPRFDDFEIERSTDTGREIDL